jgi:hypothetical protein
MIDRTTWVIGSWPWLSCLQNSPEVAVPAGIVLCGGQDAPDRRIELK